MDDEKMDDDRDGKMDDEKMDDEKDDRKKNLKNEQAQAQWDGTTQGWAGKVYDILQPIGTEKSGLWFTHKAIMKRLQNHHGETPNNLAQVLYDLVKTGHLERAIKPHKIKDHFALAPEFIYRRTAKAFKAKVVGKGMNGNPGGKLRRALQLRRNYPSFPKWFLEMME